MKTLTPAERRALKARAHQLDPVVMIGDSGLTSAVLHEIDLALNSHELIKIRALGDDREARSALADAIAEALDASPVQQIGKMLVLFRPRPPEAEAARAPKRAPRRRKPPRRTKRSYQNS